MHEFIIQAHNLYCVCFFFIFLAIEKSMLEQKKIYDDKVAEALQEQAREQ